MTEVAQGTSLARFGHGELLIMARMDAEHQKWDAQLDDELWGIFTNSLCLIAIPPFDPPGWDSFLEDYENTLKRKGWYGSSFVSRHDWVPWTEEYRRLLCGLWKNRVVSLVSPKTIELKGAHRVSHIETPDDNAFDNIEYLEKASDWGFKVTDNLVILSCGPTGTVLADRLARKGIWAVDLGNFGKFL